jgi:hypothetical protein
VSCLHLFLFRYVVRVEPPDDLIANIRPFPMEALCQNFWSQNMSEYSLPETTSLLGDFPFIIIRGLLLIRFHFTILNLKMEWIYGR